MTKRVKRMRYFPGVKSPRKCRLCGRCSNGRRRHRSHCAYRSAPPPWRIDTRAEARKVAALILTDLAGT